MNNDAGSSGFKARGRAAALFGILLMDLLKTMLSRILLAFTLVLVGGERLSLVINGLIYHNVNVRSAQILNPLIILANNSSNFDGTSELCSVLFYHFNHSLIVPPHDFNLAILIYFFRILHHLILHILLLLLYGHLRLLDDHSVHLLEVLNLIHLGVKQVQHPTFYCEVDDLSSDDHYQDKLLKDVHKRVLAVPVVLGQGYQREIFLLLHIIMLISNIPAERLSQSY